MPGSGRLQNHVLILAPTGKDAALISQMLGKESLSCVECQTADEMATYIAGITGMAILAEEALVGVPLEKLMSALSGQPPWSDFPVVFLTRTGAEMSSTSERLLELFGPNANITILERPIRVATLLSSVRSALRARRRQYEVRDYLEQRKRSDEQLMRRQKLESLGVLAGGVAHDFNNLLTGILGNASLALDSIPPGCDSLQTVLEDVVSASERAADLTRQLLAYAGKGRFIIAPLDLSAKVREISHLVHSTLPKNVNIRLELAEKLPAIEADASQIQQVVMNLMINAAESIPEGRPGEVVVTTRSREFDSNSVRQGLTSGELRPGRYVILEVRDNGAGMDDATRAKIFDPFFTTKFTGRGLGLAAVMGIVHGHKGALKVYSSPGNGSTFRVLFPAAESAGPAVVPKQVSAPEVLAHDTTVLIIDDESTVRRTAKAALEKHGFNIVLAESGKEGIDLFRALDFKIAAVLLDLTMPGMDGEEVFNTLKAIRPDVKVLLSSGFNELEVIERFTGQGLAGFIQKPYTSVALGSKMSEILEP